MEAKSFFDYDLYIFDLDNTLYSENDYLSGVYFAVAKEVFKSKPLLGIELPFLWLYEHKGTPNLFSNFIEEFGLEPSFIGECLSVLRTYTSDRKLQLYAEAGELLTSLQEENKTIYVLTNGNVEQQRNKVKNINWQGLDKNIQFVYANEYEPKPSPKCVDIIREITGTPGRDTILIGDSEIDKQCAENSGIDFKNISELLKIV